MSMGIGRRMIRASSFRVICALLLLSLLCFQQLQQASAHGGIDDGDGEDAPAVDNNNNSSKEGLVGVKVWCLVILLVFTFAGGVSPYFYRWNEAFLVLGTQFAAGVFLGTSMMHFLADSADNFRALLTGKIKQYPFAYMLACVGFLLTMLADCVIAAVANKRKVVEEEEGGGGGEQQQQQQRRQDKDPKEDQQQEHHPMTMLVSWGSNSRTSSSFSADAVLLIVALCFHSVFEGIAISVSASKSEAWRNLWTIGLHKIFAAVAMGIALLRLTPKKRPLLTSVAYSLAFAVSSPVGVGIGIGVIGATPESRAWVYAVSMGFATGIFIYVAINHLMAKGYRPQEPTRADRPFFKFLAVLLGVAVMAIVMIWD